jgi:hypothetical protein
MKYMSLNNTLMEVFCNKDVTLTYVIAEALLKIGRMSLCIRIGGKSFDKSEMVQLQILLDAYKENVQEFLGQSMIILTHTCTRTEMLIVTGGDIVVGAQLNLPKETMRVEGRLGVGRCKKLHSMIEVARAFALAALLIS